MDTKKDTTKSVYISILRIAATALVILIHASSGYLNSNNFNSFDWNYANWINSFSRFSVPIFVMISGALLLHKNEETLFFYQKRLLRLLYPFIFWSIVYLIYYFYRYTHFEQLTTQQIIDTSITRLKSGTNAHLWYLYMICGLYLTIPYLQKIVKSASKRDLEIFILLWFIALFVTNKRISSYFPRFDLTFFSGYIGYLVLGYYLSIQNLKKYKWIALILFLTISVATVFGTVLLSITKKSFDPTFYGYTAPNIALAAASFFIFIKSIAGPASLSKFWDFIDRTSFGIYLSHILILNYIHPILPVDTWLKIPLATIITLILSAILTAIIRKIPFGKYISG